MGSTLNHGAGPVTLVTLPLCEIAIALGDQPYGCTCLDGDHRDPDCSQPHRPQAGEAA